MTQHINDENLKIKNRVLIDITSRSHDKKVKFTRWVNAQSNAQSSILSLIEHMIDRFGYEDVMDHEIARKLYMEQLHFSDVDKTPVSIAESPSQQALDAPKGKVMNSSKAPEKELAAQPVHEMKIDENAF